MMCVFAFRLKLLFLGEKNTPCICAKYFNYALHWDKRKKKLTASKKKLNPNSFLALNMTQIVKSNIFTLEMFRSIDILSTQLSACL